MKRDFKRLLMVVACLAVAMCVSCKKEEEGGGDYTACDGSMEGHNYVDLGLTSGTLWATCNVGAFAPFDFGDYFAWGETEPKTEKYYDWTNYKWSTGQDGHYSKYTDEDGKTVLDREDDAAWANWGGDWRMPTQEEMEELREECKWKWIWMFKCFNITGPNGKSIILPAAGYYNQGGCYNVNTECRYWTSSIYTRDIEEAYFLLGEYRHVDPVAGDRYYGRSVRPVCSPRKDGDKLL